MTKKLKRVYTIQPASLRKVRQQQVLAMYSEGKTIPVIANTLSMRRQDVSRDLNQALADMVKQYAATAPEHNFVRYASFQLAIIDKLRSAYDLFMADPDAKQYGAAVSALRNQSEIYDKVLNKGIEFGVIQQKRAKESIRLEPKDLRLELRKEVTVLTRLLDEVDHHSNLKHMSVDQPSQRALPAHTERRTHDRRQRSRLTRKLKRVQRNEFGVIRAVPDWKYRKTIVSPQGEYVPQSLRTQQQRESLATYDPDTYLAEQVAEQTDQRVAITDDGPVLIPNQTPQTQQKRTVEQVTSTKETWLVRPSRSTDD